MVSIKQILRLQQDGIHAAAQCLFAMQFSITAQHMPCLLARALGESQLKRWTNDQPWMPHSCQSNDFMHIEYLPIVTLVHA